MVVGGCCRWSQVDAHNEVGWISGEGAKRARSPTVCGLVARAAALMWANDKISVTLLSRLPRKLLTEHHPLVRFPSTLLGHISRAVLPCSRSWKCPFLMRCEWSFPLYISRIEYQAVCIFSLYSSSIPLYPLCSSISLVFITIDSLARSYNHSIVGSPVDQRLGPMTNSLPWAFNVFLHHLPPFYCTPILTPYEFQTSPFARAHCAATGQHQQPCIAA